MSGTTNASILYVNEVATSVSAGTFTATGTLLNLGLNTITAAAKIASQDWAVDQITVTRENGNQAPTIDIMVSDRGDTAVAADEATIYDSTPEIIVNYSDLEGAIDPADVRVYVNGTDKTASFTVTATQATYQVPSCPCPPGEEWSAGSNVVNATVQDGGVAVTGYSASASAHIRLSNPTINSFSPIAEGAWGAAITISGAGFDPTAANNTVTFDGVAATVSSATRTTLDVTVPTGAQTGDVVVTVDGRASLGRVFRVVLASGRQDISSLVVNPSVSNHVFFTDKGTNDNLYEILDDGSVVARCSLPEPTGLPVDSAGRLYFGNATTPGAAGPVNRYDPAGTTCGSYVNTRLLGEATASVVGATLTDTAGLVTLYAADADNGRIKRVDPTLVVSNISSANVFTNPCGMVANGAGTVLYYTSTNSIRSVPIPGGGSSVLVRNFVGAPRGLAITSDDKLLIARTSASTNAVSWYDPASSSNPFWDLATGFPNPPGPQAVALGTDGGGPFVVVAESTRVYRIPMPSVVLTDDADNPLPTQLTVDFGSPTTDCLAANVITLKVKFSPTTLVPDTTPRQIVTWTVEDPDDPSPDPQVDPVDPTGPTPDNVRALGSYTQWGMVPGFTMTGMGTDSSVQTEVVGGVSKVTFHPSCQPGDNYRFNASVTIPIYGSIDASSDVLTVWRRLHVERDSMGVALGPFDADDAVIEDVPDPILDFMATAFTAAYVEVVVPPDTGLDTPDVRFRYSVPRTNADIGVQASLGRGSTSTEGRWVVYVQGAYDHDSAFDNDPDSEDTEFGVTDGFNRNSLSFIETMRDSQVEQMVTDLQYIISSLAVHEIGHQFGLQDETGCVMFDPGGGAPVLNPVFCPAQLRIIRTTVIPSAP